MAAGGIESRIAAMLKGTMYRRDEFEKFALDHDHFEIQSAFDDGLFANEAKTAAAVWLMRHAAEVAADAARAAQQTQERATAAAERSARWTMVAAVASAVGAVAAAAAVIVPALTGK